MCGLEYFTHRPQYGRGKGQAWLGPVNRWVQRRRKVRKIVLVGERPGRALDPMRVHAWARRCGAG